MDDFVVRPAFARHRLRLLGPSWDCAHSRIHTAKLLELSADLPIVIEIVDGADQIAVFLQDIEPMIGDGFVTVERVDVRVYRAHRRETSTGGGIQAFSAARS
ncbi:MAG TPA: DUF190 domain-containing protein [Vicinamibacterales bacterium]|nr:DUF190 domain-containing protein [Vicinamibacterales bacterium]